MKINEVKVNPNLVKALLAMQLPIKEGKTQRNSIMKIEPQGTQRVTLNFFDKQRAAAKLKKQTSLFDFIIMRRKDNKFNGLIIIRKR